MAKKKAKAPATKVGPATYDLQAWLEGYRASQMGEPHTPSPHGLDRESWIAGHLEAHKHRLVGDAIRAARAARHHGGDELADAADDLGPVSTGCYAYGFDAGVRYAAGLRWR